MLGVAIHRNAEKGCSRAHGVDVQDNINFCRSFISVLDGRRSTPGGIASRAPESESALLKNRCRHPEPRSDKTTLLLGIPDSQGDRERHPVAVRLRSMFSASGLRYYRRLGRLRKARREDGSTTNTMMRTNPTTVSVAATCRAGFGAPTTPPDASSRLSTETIMVSQMPHFLSLHKPMAPTRPAAPSTTAK